MKSPRVLISASAGSGKTHRLVHHFLGILYEALLAPNRDRQPRAVERILAATFTRAAAGEIIGRILERVAEAMLDPHKRAELCAELGAANLGEPDCEKLLSALVAGLHRLRVCTLDSFLIRSAQAFSTELGLPDNWAILDDAADQAVCLEAIDRLLDAKAADAGQFSEMVELLLMLNWQRHTLQIRGKLLEHLQKTQAALLAGPAGAWEVIVPNPAHLLATEEISGLSASLLVAAGPFIPLTKSKPRSPNANWDKAVKATSAKASAGDWDGLLGGGLIACMDKRPCTYYGIDLSPELLDLLRPFRDHAFATLLKVLYDRNCSTRDLLTEFVHEYRLAKSRRAAFRFDDFTRMLIEQKVTEKLADFYFRLDGNIDHILLDEFQDTSVAQWKLVEPLVAEIMSGQEGASGAERTFFCVGDIKQTLYGWRDAEPELLNTLHARWADIEQQFLLESRRSSPVIIETVNEIFGGLIRNAALSHNDEDHAYLTEAARVWAGWFQEHKTVKTNSGFCRLQTCECGESPGDTQKLAVRMAADRAAELHRAAPEAEIAILVRRKRFVPQLLARLRKLNIVAAGEGGSPLADDMAVCTVLSLLHLIDHPSDTAAVFHVGSSPLGQALGLAGTAHRNEVLKLCSDLRFEIVDRGLGATINHWRGLIAPNCDARNFRRLAGLVSLAHGYDYDGGDLRPFIDTVRTVNVEDSQASKVRVMTIHASKGRQFDYVILPDLDGKFISYNPAILLDRPDLLQEAGCITTYPSKGQVAAHPRLKKLSSDAKRGKVVEELCALYVAVTRAKSGVEMIVHPTSPKAREGGNLPPSPAGVLRAALSDGTAPPGRVLWTHRHSIFPERNGDASQGAALAQPTAAVVVRLAQAHRDSRLRPVLAPSSLEGSGHIHLGRLLSFNHGGGKDWGSILHRWFEMIEWLDHPLPSDDALRDAAEALGLDIGPGQLQNMLDHFHQACSAPNTRKLLSRKYYSATVSADEEILVWRERSFAVPFALHGLQDSAVVSGRLDRVVIIRQGGKAIAAEVIDFKTDQVSARTLGEKTAFYAPQIRAYRAAVAGLLRIDPSNVRAKLAFVGADLVSDSS